ncbi:MAG: LiaF domain-containing protein, partial [Candidatus Thorarchaeota archaeon]
GAHVGDVSLTAETGGISLAMTDDVVLLGNATFDLDATTGGITVVVDLPTGVGGSVEAAVGLGGVDITATGWTQITSNHYESSDYDTASQTLTVVIETTTGGVSATFT